MYSEREISQKVNAFYGVFSRAAKQAVSKRDRGFVIDYVISKAAWRDAMARERFRKESTIRDNRSAIVGFLKDKLFGQKIQPDSFDEYHCAVCRNTDYGMTYGIWQKLINMSFKYFYCVKDLFPEFEDIWARCHCPVDRIISKKL
jgi:hypothetical protein